MRKRKGLNKVMLAVVFFGVFASFSSNTFASDKKVNWSVSLSSSSPSRHNDKGEFVGFRGQRYHYHDGRFYKQGFLSFSFIAPPIGAIVKAIPSNSRVIIVKGDKYYYCNDIYYRSCHNGYIVVPSLKVNAYYAVKQPDVVSSEAVVINIPNSNGSYTAINLVKQQDGYIGPQGEYYPEHPTVEQLIALYGK